jgi:hypothetical protein
MDDNNIEFCANQLQPTKRILKRRRQTFLGASIELQVVNRIRPQDAS